MAQLKNTTINDSGFFKLPAGTTGQRPASPAATQLRFNTDTGELEQFRPGLGAWIAPSNTGGIATGGDSVYDVETEGTTYRVHVFTSTGTSTFSVLQGGEVEYLIVAGGGEGVADRGGAGGAGGLLTGTTTVTSQAYTITVGTGGAAKNDRSQGSNGGNSVAFGLTAIGGGGGGTGSGSNGSTGGSGGGAGNGNGQDAVTTGGLGTAGQGNKGGSSVYVAPNYGGGGGGGAGSPGQPGTSAVGGNGGIGLNSTLSGLSVFYAGGGGGGNYGGSSYPPGIGGLGGGGNGAPTTATAGTPNTGGGGGSNGSGTQGVAGGSGIVIVRYPLRQNNPETAAGQDVGNGLVLDLDFAKPTVYSGSGSVVNDSRIPNAFQGNINGASYVNARTHRSAFNFSQDNILGNFDYNYDKADFTLIAWVYPETFNTGGNSYCAVMNRSDGSNHVFSCFVQSTATSTPGRMASWHFNSGGSNISQNSQNLFLQQNEWNMLVYHYTDGSGYTYYLYNSAEQSKEVRFQNYTPRTAYNSQYTIGRWRNGNYFWDGDIAYINFYNRTLPDAEIENVFNATRWRFGV